MTQNSACKWSAMTNCDKNVCHFVFGEGCSKCVASSTSQVSPFSWTSVGKVVATHQKVANVFRCVIEEASADVLWFSEGSCEIHWFATQIFCWNSSPLRARRPVTSVKTRDERLWCISLKRFHHSGLYRFGNVYVIGINFCLTRFHSLTSVCFNTTGKIFVQIEMFIVHDLWTKTELQLDK